MSARTPDTSSIGAVPKPMLATSAPTVPVGRLWTYEVKWDGYRTLALKDDGRVALYSRNLKDATRLYPTIAAALSALPVESVLLDGELVAVDDDGRPSFQALHHSTAHSLAYYVFDLLHLNGRGLVKAPLTERRAALARISFDPPIFRSDPLPGAPHAIERAVRALGLEGVVAKRRDSVYQPGRRSGAWIKVRFARRQEFVVGGFKPGGTTFDSILVGYFDGRALSYAGKVRAGFTPASRAEVAAAIAPLVTVRCPFANLPNSTGKTHWGEGVTAEEMRALRWVKPRVVVEVEYVEWTRGGSLRHAAFAGLREDKRARDVRWEVG